MITFVCNKCKKKEVKSNTREQPTGWGRIRPTGNVIKKSKDGSIDRLLLNNIEINLCPNCVEKLPIDFKKQPPSELEDLMTDMIYEMVDCEITERTGA